MARLIYTVTLEKVAADVTEGVMLGHLRDTFMRVRRVIPSRTKLGPKGLVIRILV
jgi:hypothetical protein